MILKNNFIKNDYLYHCDQVNKYNIKSIHRITKLENVIFEFSINNFIKAAEYNVNEEDILIKTKAFLFLYLLSSTVPFINSNKLKIIKKQEKDGSSYYALKIILENKKDINQFLFTLFIENWNNALIDDIKILDDKILYNEKSKNISIYNCIFPASILFECNNILNVLSGINTKDFFINISFIFKNLNHLYISTYHRKKYICFSMK
jgi:hypothetical protein